MGCGILGFEFRYGQDVDMEGLDRSAETVAKLLLNEKTRGEIPLFVGSSFGIIN